MNELKIPEEALKDKEAFEILRVLLSGKRFEKKEREVFKDLPLLVVLSYHTKNTNEQKYLFYRTADIRSVIAIYSPRYDPSYNRRS
jgi:hypothetical protein